MGDVYWLTDDGRTTPLRRVQCRNEDRELQRILVENHDLLPGAQIDPEAPRRWILVKREMPVPDPSSGNDRWSIDLLFLDQSAVPTFVECKRFLDTRSRREVVAQMLDYAANGKEYWSAKDLENYARETAAGRGLNLEELLKRLAPDSDDDTARFFCRAEANLREGQSRLIFFLEESGWELRSIVKFMNDQMERTDVMIVEARKYSNGETTIVVPTLFGFTEEARRIKRVVTVESRTGITHGHWSEQDLTKAIGDAAPNYQQAVVALIGGLKATGFAAVPGKGRRPSLNFIWPAAGTKSLLCVDADARLWFYLHVMFGSPLLEKLRSDLAAALRGNLGIVPKDDEREYFPVAGEIWASRTTEILSVVKQSVAGS